MTHTYKHFNGATIEEDDNGKKRVFYEGIEFDSIAAVNRYINSIDHKVKVHQEMKDNQYYGTEYLKNKSGR